MCEVGDKLILKGDSTKPWPFRDNSIDAIVTDSPYLLRFMNKSGDSCHINLAGENEGQKMQAWHSLWLKEAYRALKPGASLLVMGGDKTFHRLAIAIEDSGFLLKHTLCWLFGSGFPKAQDASVLADAKVLGISTIEVRERREKQPNPLAKKQTGQEAGKGLVGAKNDNLYLTPKPLTPEGKTLEGFRIGGIKPAVEYIIWAVKPPESSMISNVLKWGVGAVNVAETRISLNGNRKVEGGCHKNKTPYHLGKLEKVETNQSLRRFPANVILSHHPECVQRGVKKVKPKEGFRPNPVSQQSDGNIKFTEKSEGYQKLSYTDPNGLETVENWECHPDCAVFLLDKQSGVLKSGKDNIRSKEGFFVEHGGLGGAGDVQVSYGDSGGASRFYYCAKASKSERQKGLESKGGSEGELKNAHPT